MHCVHFAEWTIIPLMLSAHKPGYLAWSLPAKFRAKAVAALVAFIESK